MIATINSSSSSSSSSSNSSNSSSISFVIFISSHEFYLLCFSPPHDTWREGDGWASGCLS